MARRLTLRKSHADILRSNDAALRFMAGGKPIPEGMLSNPPPKRERKRRTVASGPSEHQIQVAVIHWWARAHHGYSVPVEALFAIPNGGARDVITGARLKAEGVRRGTPDLMLAMRVGSCAGLFIEMKVADNKLSDPQRAFEQYAIDAGYSFATCYTSEAAIKEIRQYIENTPPF